MAAHANDQVMLDGKIVDGRAFMPLRAAGDGIGAVTTWNQKTQTATVKKDGKVLEVKLGKFVKLFDNRVYIQFREFNETFFENDKIYWNKDVLIASSEHITVNLQPLTKEEAIKIATPSAQPRWQQFLKETEGFNVAEQINWIGLNSFKATYSSAWSNSGYDYYNNLSTIEVTMIKKGNTWIRTSLKYQKGWLLPPH